MGLVFEHFMSCVPTLQGVDDALGPVCLRRTTADLAREESDVNNLQKQPLTLARGSIGGESFQSSFRAVHVF